MVVESRKDNMIMAKTGNDFEVEAIMKLSKDELFRYVMDNPDYLTDYYYNIFRNAIYRRYEELE